MAVGKIISGVTSDGMEVAVRVDETGALAVSGIVEGGGNTGGSGPVGGVVKDSFFGSTTITKTYQTDMNGFAIVNDGEDTDITVTIGSITIKVAPGETFDDNFESFKEVKVEATSAFRAIVRG